MRGCADWGLAGRDPGQHVTFVLFLLRVLQKNAVAVAVVKRGRGELRLNGERLATGPWCWGGWGWHGPGDAGGHAHWLWTRGQVAPGKHCLRTGPAVLRRICLLVAALGPEGGAGKALARQTDDPPPPMRWR